MFNIKKSIHIIIIMIVLISCSKSSNKEEIEPNNTFSSATEITINDDYSGLLDSENDIDNYLLKISEEQVIHIELTAVKGINHAIQIRRLDSSKPQLIKVIDDNRKSSSEELSNLFVYPGVYIFTVTHGSGDLKKGNPENRYFLKIKSKHFSNEEKEPNDSYLSANEINNGEILTGFFSPSRNSLNENSKSPYREEDWFKTQIISGEDNPVTIDLVLKGVAGVDSILSLYNSDMEEISSSNNSSSGGSEAITGTGLKTSGTYYICVTSKSFQSNHTAPYELSLKLNTHDSRNELEPNNNFETANKINQNEISGRINQSGDMDYFIYSDIKNSNVRIRLKNTDGLDTGISVYNQEKNKILDINNTGSGFEEIIPSVYVVDFIYLKIIAASRSSQEMSYNIIVEPITIPDTSEIEPNDLIKEANILENEITGFTSHKADKDYFQIKTNERKKFKVIIKAPKHGSIKISTTDQLGYLIKTKNAANGETINMIEMFDRKGYILIDTIIPDFENPYNISIEEIK